MELFFFGDVKFRVEGSPLYMGLKTRKQIVGYSKDGVLSKISDEEAKKSWDWSRSYFRFPSEETK